MIPNALVRTLCLCGVAWSILGSSKAFAVASTPIAETAPPRDEPAEAEQAAPAPLERYRVPLPALIERNLGSTARSVRFNWRTTTVGVAAIGSQLSELNNFRSARYGGAVRTPIGPGLGELALTRVEVWNTDSSRKLALTPYRQWGRPDRLELDLNYSLPIAEGVVTAWPSFFPAAELVLSITAGLRYAIYPEIFADVHFRDGAHAVVAPQLDRRELRKLDRDRPAAMRIDKARFGLLVGVSADVYLGSGIYVTPRVLMAEPLFSAMMGTHLGMWWEQTLLIGWAY